jgi:hypothetical protein
MTTTTQPNTPTIAIVSSVDVLSPPPDATDIVDAGQPVRFRVNMALKGLNAVLSMYVNQPVQVKHHIQQIETGAVATLGPTIFNTPATVDELKLGFDFTTGPYSTSTSSGTGDFKTAPGDDDAVYRVVTELHFANARSNSVFDDRILVVTLP